MEDSINVFFATDETVNSLHENHNKVTEFIRQNPLDSKWLQKMISGKIFEERKNKIINFQLKVDVTGDYSKVEAENAIILYESLKQLPRYVLTDERFWVWINLEKCYRATIQSMPLKKETTFAGTWIFTRGKRRSLFFGPHSRSYFWTEFTIDESREDKYELTRFVFEKIERIRNLTWRSNNRHIVISAIKAEKDLFDKYYKNEKFSETFKKCEMGENNHNIYTYITKYISLYGSVRMLEVLESDKLSNIIYKELERVFLEVHKGNLNALKR